MRAMIIYLGPFCRVPNIRFNVAKVLKSLIPIVDQSVSEIFLFFWRRGTTMKNLLELSKHEQW